ncbi:MAG: glycosyltransferase [bacterium]|nr:glycosyltransferase [bacterium]
MSESTRVAAIIPAKDEAEFIAATVRACRAIPRVDLVLVVDDGSEDDTQHAARSAGAVVVRHSVNRGKASAMETGGSVVAMRDIEGREPRHLLFVDGDLGESATSLTALVNSVASGEADLAIGAFPDYFARGSTDRLARRAIQRSTGWIPAQPLSGQRCITREAFAVASPLARGWGVDVGMTIDVLTAGFTVQELPCYIRHRPQEERGNGGAQYRDIALAVAARRLRGVRAPRELVARGKTGQPAVGEPYGVAYP